MIRFSYPPDTEPSQNRAIPREGRAASPASAWLGARLIVPAASRSALPVCAAVLALAGTEPPGSRSIAANVRFNPKGIPPA